MDFPQAIVSGFKQYATFSGRAARSEYWYWVLFAAIGGGVASILDIGVLGVNAHDHHALQPLHAAFCLITFLPGLAVAARRLHDVNRSGWLMLIALTIIGLIPLFIWYCSQGTQGENRFGPDPLA